MANRTKAQKAASKILSKRNERVLQIVSDNMKVYDADFAHKRPGGTKDYVAREAFMQMCLKGAKADVGVVSKKD